MAAPPLPAFARADDGDAPCCPWCASYQAGAATVSLDQLALAHNHGQLNRWAGGPHNTADACDLAADCPDCGKPFVVTLRERSHGESYMRLDPVRTAADARLLTDG